jgi:hypothetical protein
MRTRDGEVVGRATGCTVVGLSGAFPAAAELFPGKSQIVVFCWSRLNDRGLRCVRAKRTLLTSVAGHETGVAGHETGVALEQGRHALSTFPVLASSVRVTVMAIQWTNEPSAAQRPPWISAALSSSGNASGVGRRKGWEFVARASNSRSSACRINRSA